MAPVYSKRTRPNWAIGNRITDFRPFMARVKQRTRSPAGSPPLANSPPTCQNHVAGAPYWCKHLTGRLSKHRYYLHKRKVRPKRWKRPNVLLYRMKPRHGKAALSRAAIANSSVFPFNDIVKIEKFLEDLGRGHWPEFEKYYPAFAETIAKLRDAPPSLRSIARGRQLYDESIVQRGDRQLYDEIVMEHAARQLERESIMPQTVSQPGHEGIMPQTVSEQEHESFMQQTIRQLAQKPAAAERCLTILSSLLARPGNFTANEEALLERFLSSGANSAPPNHGEGASSASNGGAMATDIQHLPRLHLDMSKKRAIITLAASPRRGAVNWQNHFITQQPFNLPRELFRRRDNHTNNPNRETIRPQMLRLSHAGGMKQSDIHRQRIMACFGGNPTTVNDVVTMDNEVRRLCGKLSPLLGPAPPAGDMGDHIYRLRANLARPLKASDDADYAAFRAATINCGRYFYLMQKIVEKHREWVDYEPKLYRYYEAMQQSNLGQQLLQGAVCNWYGPSYPPVSAEEIASLEMDVQAIDKDFLFESLMETASNDTPAHRQALGDADAEFLFAELKYVDSHPREANPYRVRGLAFDFAYPVGATKPLDSLMSVPELEAAWVAFQVHGYSEPLPKAYEPIRMVHNIEEDSDVEEMPSGHQSKRRRIAADDIDLEVPEADMAFLCISGSPLPTADVPTSDVPIADVPTADVPTAYVSPGGSPGSDGDIYVDANSNIDSDDEVSLIQTTPINVSTASLSAAVENQAETTNSGRSSDQCSVPGTQQPPSALSIFQALQPSNALSTQQTAHPANTISQVQHSSQFSQSFGSSLSLNDFAAMSLIWGTDDDDAGVSGSGIVTATSSFSTVDMEDTIMADRPKENTATSVSTRKPSSAIQQAGSGLNHTGQGGRSTQGNPLQSASLTGESSIPTQSSDKEVDRDEEMDSQLAPSDAAAHSSEESDSSSVHDLPLSNPSSSNKRRRSMSSSSTTENSPMPSAGSKLTSAPAPAPAPASGKICPNCKRPYKHSGYLQNHLRICVAPPPESVSNFPCPRCAKPYQKLGNLNNHAAICDGSPYVPPNPRGRRPSALSDAYDGPVQLPRADLTDSFGRPLCSACTTSFTSRAGLERHIAATCRVLRKQGVYDARPLAAADCAQTGAEASSGPGDKAGPGSGGGANQTKPTMEGSRKRRVVVETSPAKASGDGESPQPQHPPTSSTTRTLPHPGTLNAHPRTTMARTLSSRVDPDDTEPHADNALYCASPTPGAKHALSFSAGQSAAAADETPTAAATAGPSTARRLSFAAADAPQLLSDRKPPPTRRQLFRDAAGGTPRAPLDALRDPFVDTPGRGTPPQPGREAPGPPGGEVKEEEEEEDEEKDVKGKGKAKAKPKKGGLKKKVKGHGRGWNLRKCAE